MSWLSMLRTAVAPMALLAVSLSGCAVSPRGPAAGGPAPTPVRVVAEAGATAVAVSLVAPGSAWEDGSTTGVTLLAARALLEEAAQELARLGAEAAVRCGPWSFVFTVVAPAETWPESAELVQGLLARPVLSEAAVERARSGLLASLALDRANPAWQARLAADRALRDASGGAPSWSGPACGVPEMLPLFDADAVRRAAARLVPIRSAVVLGAIAGPGDSIADVLFADVRSGVRRVSGISDGGTSAGGTSTGAEPSPGSGTPVPGRVYVERNTITAWVSVIWPFGPEADPEAVGLVGALLEEAVEPGVGRPGVLDVSTEVTLDGGGGSLVVTAVVEPGEASAVGATLEAAAAALAEGRVHASVIDRVVRRHHGDRLRALAAPEARASRLAVALARGQAVEVWPGKDSFTAAAVRIAAGQLGRPARAVVGPRTARRAVVP